VKVREEVVFKWLVIIVAVVAFLVAVSLLIRPLVGAILVGVLAIAGVVYLGKWAARAWREAGESR
jgi:hypothetical protein